MAEVEYRDLRKAVRQMKKNKYPRKIYAAHLEPDGTVKREPAEDWAERLIKEREKHD